MLKSFVSAALAAAIAQPALAQEQAAPEGAEPLSRQAFIAEMDAQFQRLDADGDRTVTEAEILASQRAAAEQEALRQNQAVFAQLDGDGDGMLSPQEFAQLANPDAVPVAASPILTQFDANGDGTVTLLEYRIATQANFDRIDGDRDGIVTPEEMGAAGIGVQ